MRKQVPIRIDENLYKQLRIMLAKEDKTFQKYMELLVLKDLKERGVNINE